MNGKTLEDIQRFQKEAKEEFDKRLETYIEREEQAQKDFNELIYGPDEEEPTET